MQKCALTLKIYLKGWVDLCGFIMIINSLGLAEKLSFKISKETRKEIMGKNMQALDTLCTSGL